MNRYKFYYDKYGEFNCLYSNDYADRNYKNDDAIRKLQRIDRQSFRSVKIKERTHNKRKYPYIEMSNGNTTVSIRNINRFNNDELFEYLPNNIRKIEKAFTKYNNRNSKSAARNLLVAGLIVTMISSGIALSLNKDKSNDIAMSSTSTIVSQTEEESTEEELSEVYEMIIDEDNNQINYEFDRETDSSDFKYVDETYGDLVDEVGKKYGVSPSLIKAMITQESSGVNPNLMQIQFDSWIDMLLVTHDFVNDKDVKLVLTDNPEEYSDDVITISRDELLNPNTNISVGTVLLRETASYYDYNIPMSIQAYNFGIGNMDKVINQLAYVTNDTYDGVVANKNDIDYMNYTNIINVGDFEYLYHVMRYVDSSDINISYLDENNNICSNDVKVYPEANTKVNKL